MRTLLGCLNGVSQTFATVAHNKMAFSRASLELSSSDTYTFLLTTSAVSFTLSVSDFRATGVVEKARVAERAMLRVNMVF